VAYDNYQLVEGLGTGWGYACVIATPDKKILFDTGADSPTLISNMEGLDIEPDSMEIVVLSHAHLDHVGGLDGFLQRKGHVTVYIPSSFPNSVRDVITARGEEYEDVTDATEISAGFHTTGEMGGAIIEQSVVLDTPVGSVVITGCAHPGIVSIVARAKEMLPGKEVHFVMGGFHLLSASDSQLTSIIGAFRDLGVQKVAPSHCSGDRCQQLFKEEYGIHYIESGVGHTTIYSRTRPTLTRVGSTLSLSWEPFDTGAYAVQFRDDLLSGKWRNAPGTWPITDTIWTEPDISQVDKRYYRIVSR